MRFILKMILGVHTWVYRTTSGGLGGRVGKAPVLLLTTRGRKTGKPRTTPLLYLQDGGQLAIVASNGGSDHHPAWYFNLERNPLAEVQIGRHAKMVHARPASPAEKTRLWARLTELYPGYQRYQERTRREIPVVLLDPVEPVDSKDQG